MTSASQAASAGMTGSYPTQAQSGPAGAVVPFFYGSNQYAEKIATDVQQLGAATIDFQHNINPGGFLRGVRLLMRSASGAGGTLTADTPWNVFYSISLENIDGSPIQYPMGGYAYAMGQKYFRPWGGDPLKRYDAVSTGQNPAGSLFIQPEIRHTAGCLANTDARAQYRIRFTLNTATAVGGAYTTAPTVTVTSYLETWAQPDATDLHGNEIEPVPQGLNLATIRRHQPFVLNGAGANNVFQVSLTGNEVRGSILVVRDSNNARQNYLTDPIRVRLDNRSLGTFSPDEVWNRMSDFYDFLMNGTSSIETGVYVFPRFYRPGDLVGEAWQATTNATYWTLETTTLSTGVNLPGTVEIITDEVVPVGPIPAELDAI